jgi:hypothetical protein
MTLGALAITLWGETENIGAAIALSWVVAAAAWGIYGFVVYCRWKYIKKFDVELEHGIMVARNGYLVSSLELAAELDRFVGLWEKHMRVRKRLEEDRIWVVFHPGVIENKGKYEKVAGFVTVGGNVAHVAYFKRIKDGVYVKDPGVSIERTAFAHELGHIVMAREWGDWDQERHHAFTKAEGLP